MGLDNTQDKQGNPILPMILQLLPTIYRMFQQDSQTAIHENKEGMDRQLGMGRQRTASMRRIKDKTHHSTSTGLLRPPRTNQNQNRRLKIPLHWYTVTTMAGRKMETSGVPIQNHVRRWDATTIFTIMYYWR